MGLASRAPLTGAFHRKVEAAISEKDVHQPSLLKQNKPLLHLIGEFRGSAKGRFISHKRLDLGTEPFLS